MKTFLTDNNGFTQRDYLLLFSTIFYATVVICILYRVLAHPDEYTAEMLNFLYTVIKSVSVAYNIIIVCYFGNHTGSKFIRTRLSKNNAILTTNQEDNTSV